MSKVIIDATDASFETEVLRSGMPVLVDFWAPWCGPCVALTPVLEDYAKAYMGKVKFVKLNVDENVSTRDAYGVRGLPLLALFHDGKIQKRLASNTTRELAATLQSVVDAAELVVPVKSGRLESEGGVPAAFEGDAGRKEICLVRLRNAAQAGDLPPSRRIAGNGDSSDLPKEMLKLVDELWDVLRKTRSPRRADETVLAIIDAVPVGADLNPLLMGIAQWLLYDPASGVSSYLPQGDCALLFHRLGALHRAEVQGGSVEASQFESVRKDALALVEREQARELRSLPPDERFAWNMAARLERSLALPLAEVGASWAFVTMLIADIIREEPSFLRDAELDRLNAIGEVTRLKIEAAIGSRPLPNAAAQADWSEQYQVLRKQYEEASRQAEPALFERLALWNARQVEMAAELAGRVANHLVLQMAQLAPASAGAEGCSAA